MVAHCLLNESVRCLSGATYSGVVPKVVKAALDHGLGLVQMPHPERHALGGVLKTHLRPLDGRGGPWAARRPVRHLVAATLTQYTRLRMIPLGRHVARDLRQYGRPGSTSSPWSGSAPHPPAA